MQTLPAPSILSDPSLLESAAKKLEAELSLRAARNKLRTYRPYRKQSEFHEAGRTFRERLFLAGNQLGKTLAGSYELAAHLTGQYPEDWKGRRWDRPTVWWAAGVTGETTRDTVQRLLMGRPGGHGTGAIPHDSIIASTRALGVSDLLDTVRVKHVSGGESILALKFYEKGRQKWQAETLDGVWFDEEPPSDIYSEGLTRTNATKGMVYLTCTPLLGMTEVIRGFLLEPTPERHTTKMTIDDAEHYTPEERAVIVRGYKPHEREARAKGIPMLGSGRIFPVAEEKIVIEPIKLPRHWKRIGGLDFGFDHPFAGVELAHDADEDVIYVTREYRAREEIPSQHCGALRQWGTWLPWAWPSDGLDSSRTGEPVKDDYRKLGLNMLPEHAQFEEGSVSVEAGILEMLERMQTGRWKVFSTCGCWIEEFRLYHRDEGKIVKLGEDTLSASRYALMMRRFAKVEPDKSKAATAHKPKWVV